MTTYDLAKPFPPIRLGVSACVIGEKVRFDGGHKQFDFLVKTLKDYVTFKPMCPEVKAGLGIPRPAIRLVSMGEGICIKGTRDPDLDVTDKLEAACHQLSQEAQGLTGFVFCAKSPSCGMERVKVYNESGQLTLDTQPGVFAQQLMLAYPNLPCEETGRLNDLLIRESFLNRLFCYARWQELLQSGLTPTSLIQFHAAHKLLLMAHSPKHYQMAGPILANLSEVSLAEQAEHYLTVLMGGLKVPATRKKHTNVLMHIQGYFKKHLDKLDKKTLTEMILRYQQGMLPLGAPVEMLSHQLRRYPNQYLQLQHYFSPYPEPLRVKSII
jgi:uncharacterized protein YbgA (DUF1722 family)/uncharacterized protein YbbK (DUF523 family)